MREALNQVIERLQTCTDLLDANLELKRVGDVIGVPRISATDDYSAANLILGEQGYKMAEVFGWDRDYVETWVGKKLNLNSPIGHACRFATRPFVWHTQQFWDHSPTLSKPQQQVIDFLTTRGVWGGITVPIHRPRGRLGSVGWTAIDDSADLDAIVRDHTPQLTLIGHYFLDVVYQSRDEEPPSPESASLSEREIECMTWVALGKTDAEIGSIIGRSPTTARFHIEKAMKKLGASTRTQAAAMASQLGVIGPVV